MNAGLRTGLSAFLTLQIKIGIADCLPASGSWITEENADCGLNGSDIQYNLGRCCDWRCTVSCRSCSSENEAEFTAQIMIHFSGRWLCSARSPYAHNKVQLSRVTLT